MYIYFTCLVLALWPVNYSHSYQSIAKFYSVVMVNYCYLGIGAYCMCLYVIVGCPYVTVWGACNCHIVWGACIYAIVWGGCMPLHEVIVCHIVWGACILCHCMRWLYAIVYGVVVRMPTNSCTEKYIIIIVYRWSNLIRNLMYIHTVHWVWRIFRENTVHKKYFKI